MSGACREPVRVLREAPGRAGDVHRGNRGDRPQEERGADGGRAQPTRRTRGTVKH